MRTTIDLDDDILQAAKELASGRGRTIGKVVSELARRGLAQSAGQGQTPLRNGVPLLPRRAPGDPRPTMKRVNDGREAANERSGALGSPRANEQGGVQGPPPERE